VTNYKNWINKKEVRRPIICLLTSFLLIQLHYQSKWFKTHSTFSGQWRWVLGHQQTAPATQELSRRPRHLLWLSGPDHRYVQAATASCQQLQGAVCQPEKFVNGSSSLQETFHHLRGILLGPRDSVSDPEIGNWLL
jgi:hypothetical protein